MQKFIVILYVVFPAALSLGQQITLVRNDMPATDRSIDGIEPLSKRFPPEFIIPAKDGHPAKFSGCIHRLPDKASLSIKPCQDIRNRPRLIPPFQNSVPTTKP